MAYATEADYNQYGEGLIPSAEVERVLERASDQVDNLTYNRISAYGIDNLTPFQLERVIKAVCQQADFVYQYGSYLDMPLSGYSAGGVSVSLKVSEGPGGVKTTDSVIALLKASGLTHRGVW